VDAGYVLKDRHGRRNHYRVQLDQPLPEALLRQRDRRPTAGPTRLHRRKHPRPHLRPWAATRSRHRCRAVHRAVSPPVHPESQVTLLGA
jgi:hypothetical protein